MTKRELDIIGGLNMTDQLSNEAYKQIMIVAEDDEDTILDCITEEIQNLRGASCSCTDGTIDSVEDIIDKYRKNDSWKLKPCPFCGSKDIGVKDTILDRHMGNDCPSSATRKVWAYCRYCGAEGSKHTGDFVYDSEIMAAAIEKWNRRAGC